MLDVAGRMWVELLVLCLTVLGGGCLEVLLGWWRLVVGTVRARKARPQQLLLLHDGALRDYLGPSGGGGGTHLCPSRRGRGARPGGHGLEGAGEVAREARHVPACRARIEAAMEEAGSVGYNAHTNDEMMSSHVALRRPTRAVVRLR